MDNLQLTQLITTRISHDLSGMLGAVYNGTELLLEDLSFAQESATLIKDSSENLINRMRFFRQTFGLAKTDEDQTENYLKTFSMPFVLNGVCEDNLIRSLIMALTDYFYKGAEFNITSNKITAKGVALKDISSLKNILLFANGPIESVNAPAFYAYTLAYTENKTFLLNQNNDQLEIQIITRQER